MDMLPVLTTIILTSFMSSSIDSEKYNVCIFQYMENLTVRKPFNPIFKAQMTLIWWSCDSNVKRWLSFHVVIIRLVHSFLSGTSYSA